MVVMYEPHHAKSCFLHMQNRVGTSIVQSVNSSGKCRKMPARQILQNSLKWQILAFMNKFKLKTSKKVRFLGVIGPQDSKFPHL